MTKEEIRALSMDDVKERLAALLDELEEPEEGAEGTEGQEEEARSLDAIEEEMNILKERKAELEKIAETRAALKEEVSKDGVVIKKFEERKEEPKMNEITTASKEYRDAFYAMIAGTATAEQRAVLSTPISVDGDATYDGAAIAIPKSLDEKIWDNIHTAHPILDDITRVSSGVVIEVTKHTAITAGKTAKKKDGATNSAASVATEANTFVKVQLTGNDFVKYVELTYAEAKMSQGALEDYLAEEIAADIGEAIAKDVFAQILSDGASNGQALGSLSMFEGIAATLGKATKAVKPVIYCTAASYYSIFGAVDDNGQPIFRNGVAVGAEVKIDSAVPATISISSTDYALDAIVVDPNKFLLNEVQPIMIETDKDIKEHRVIVSGYERSQGCMRDNNAAAFLYHATT